MSYQLCSKDGKELGEATDFADIIDQRDDLVTVELEESDFIIKHEGEPMPYLSEPHPEWWACGCYEGFVIEDRRESCTYCKTFKAQEGKPATIEDVLYYEKATIKSVLSSRK